jgi:hypothetical protein
MRHTISLLLILVITSLGYADKRRGVSRRTTNKETYVKVKSLPSEIRFIIESNMRGPNNRVVLQKIDLNHDGKPEWLISNYEVTSTWETYKEEKGKRHTWLFMLRGGNWRLLESFETDKLKIIPAKNKDNMDDIESSVHDETYLYFRWINGKYTICQCRNEKREIIKCNDIRIQSSTLKERGFTVDESCAPRDK